MLAIGQGFGKYPRLRIYYKMKVKEAFVNFEVDSGLFFKSATEKMSQKTDQDERSEQT